MNRRLKWTYTLLSCSFCSRAGFPSSENAGKGEVLVKKTLTLTLVPWGRGPGLLWRMKISWVIWAVGRVVLEGSLLFQIPGRSP